MAYIDKVAIVTELEARYNECLKRTKIVDAEYWNGKADAYRDMLVVLDTLEVIELDLKDTKKEKLTQEYVNYTFNRFDIDPESKEAQLIYYAYMHGINQCLTQLRAYKGE